MENTTNDTHTVDAATEVHAMATLVEAFKSLDSAAIERVLDWAAKRYGARTSVARVERTRRLAQEAAGNSGSAEGLDGADGRFADLGDLYNAARPTTDADKVLVAAYWHHVHQQKENFDSLTLNADLKQLGHQVGNVTRACSALMREKPALMIQRKTGSTKQARKVYRLTAAGIDRVRKMLGSRVDGIDSEGQ